MVLKRGLLLAILLALLIIFVQLDSTKNVAKTKNNALISFDNATIYDIGQEYVRIQAKKILRYKNKDIFKMIHIEFLNIKNETYTIRANNGVLKNDIMELDGNVVCIMTDSGKLTTNKLFYNQKTKFIYNNQKFKLNYVSHTLRGRNFSLNSSNNHFDALDTRFVLKVPKTNKEKL